MQVLSHRVQGSESAFSPYIRNLPVGVAGIPMFFGRDPLRALEYAPVTRQVQMRCQWLLHFAREALQSLPGTPADPFSGVLVDANALGMHFADEHLVHAGFVALAHILLKLHPTPGAGTMRCSYHDLPQANRCNMSRPGDNN